MSGLKKYMVHYKMHEAGSVKSFTQYASNKAEAYDWATFDGIPKVEGCTPYSSWVTSVMYSNGNYREFNTFEGNPY